MNKWRLSILIFIIGAVFKTVLVVLWRLNQPAELYKLLISYDPIGIWAAKIVTSICFDQRRLAPSPNETLFFEIALVVFFAIECVILVLIVRTVIRKIFSNRGAELKSSAS